MNTKTKILVVIVYTLVIFAVGRYTVPTKVIEKTHNDQETTKNKNTNVKEKKDRKKTTVITKKPNGEVVTIITDETTQDKDSSTKTNSDTKKESDTFKEIVKASPLNISALMGANLSSKEFQQIYGLSVNKQLIGPITVGIFGFNNGTLGVSVGINL